MPRQVEDLIEKYSKELATKRHETLPMLVWADAREVLQRAVSEAYEAGLEDVEIRRRAEVAKEMEAAEAPVEETPKRVTWPFTINDPETSQ